MSGFFVTELACPNCRTPYHGLDTDRVFVCLECEKAMEITQGKVTGHPVMFAPASESTKQRLVYLPFWKIGVKIEVFDPNGQDVLGSSGVDDLDSVWVSAFFELRSSYLGNPGVDLTRRRACPLNEVEPPANARVVGGARTSLQAKPYATVFVTDIVDKHKDVTGYTIRVADTSVEYWAVPFAYDPEQQTLFDLTGGNTYKARVVENIGEILGVSAD